MAPRHREDGVRYPADLPDVSARTFIVQWVYVLCCQRTDKTGLLGPQFERDRGSRAGAAEGALILFVLEARRQRERLVQVCGFVSSCD